MGTRFQTTACPLCSDSFDDADEYREHLAFMHELVDDEGAETVLEEAPVEPEPAPVVAAEPVIVVSTPTALQTAALTNPVDMHVHVDRRVMPGLVAAVVLQLVIALLGLAVVDGGSSGSKLNSDTAAAAAGNSSSDAGKAANAGAAATTVPPTTVPPAPDTHNDQARANAFAPRTTDFPAGWQQSNPADLGDSGDDSATAQCSPPDDPTEHAVSAGADGAFEHEASFAFASAMMLNTEADALKAMTMLREQASCLGDGLAADMKSEFPRGVTITHGSFSSLGFPSYGDESIALSMPVSVVGAVSVPLRVDLLAVRRDRAVMFMLAVVGANDYTPAQERGTLSAIADRMNPSSI